MTTTSKERAAMQQALEAIGDCSPNKALVKAAYALREALDHSGEANEMVIGWDRVKPEAIASDPLYQQGFVDGVEEGRNQIAEQADGEQWSPDDMAYRPSGLSMEQAEREPWKCACGANLYIDSNGAPASKADQAEQDPVAWAYIDADGSFMDALDRQHGAYKTPLYTAPVRTKDLTDEDFVQSEVKSLRQQVAALKAILDAWNNVEQEPVAWVDLEQWQSGEYDCFTSEKVADYMTPLYTAPVRTKDLTNSEKLYILGSHIDPTTKDVMGLSLIDAVIAADREKNRE